jgi:hypothetical protein
MALSAAQRHARAARKAARRKEQLKAKAKLAAAMPIEAREKSPRPGIGPRNDDRRADRARAALLRAKMAQ